MLPTETLLQGGKYKVAKQLSSGGFGNTYVVENLYFHETYAMKEFFMKGITQRKGTVVAVSQPENNDVFQEQKQKFKKEAQRLRILEHPGIVHIHDLFEENDTFYYVMDLIDGESLAEREKRHKAMSEDEAIDMLGRLLNILAVVHASGFTHNDIKPANIMAGRDGGLYLIDFGASKQMTTKEKNTLTTSTAMPYTEGYAPVEQVDRMLENIGPWTDLYAVGATLYNMLTLKRPPLTSAIINNGEEAFNFPKGVSETMRNLIVWMMQPRRQNRPQTVFEVMERLPTGNGTDTVIKKPEKKRPDKKKKSNKLILIIIAVLLAIAAVAYFVYQNNHKRYDSEAVPVLDEDYMEQKAVDEKRYDNKDKIDESHAPQRRRHDDEATKAKDDKDEHDDTMSQDGGISYSSPAQHFNTRSTQHHHLVGYFHDHTGRYPVELDFNTRGKTISNVIYKNVTYGGRIKMNGIFYDDFTEMEFTGKDGSNDFSIVISSIDGKRFSGQAADGTKYLDVTLTAQCSH